MTNVTSKIYQCEYPEMVCRWNVEQICEIIGCKFEDIDREETCVVGLDLVIFLKNGNIHLIPQNGESLIETMKHTGPCEYGWEDED